MRSLVAPVCYHFGLGSAAASFFGQQISGWGPSQPESSRQNAVHPQLPQPRPPQAAHPTDWSTVPGLSAGPVPVHVYVRVCVAILAQSFKVRLASKLQGPPCKRKRMIRPVSPSIAAFQPCQHDTHERSIMRTSLYALATRHLRTSF